MFQYMIARFQQQSDNDRTTRARLCERCNRKLSTDAKIWRRFFRQVCLSRIWNCEDKKYSDLKSNNHRSILEHEIHSEKSTFQCALFLIMCYIHIFYQENSQIRRLFPVSCRLRAILKLKTSLNTLYFSKIALQNTLVITLMNRLNDNFGESWIGQYVSQHRPA